MKSKTTKGIAVLLACFLGMAAVGCSGDNDSSSKNSDAAEVSAATLPVETDEQGECEGYIPVVSFEDFMEFWHPVRLISW